jgi:ribosomal protein L39E
MSIIKRIKARSQQRSEAYHENIKSKLAEGAQRMQKAQKSHGAIPAYVDPQEAAQTAQSVFKHEVARHVDKRGRVTH